MSEVLDEQTPVRAYDRIIAPNERDALAMQTAEFVAWETRRQSEAGTFYAKYEELIERHAQANTNWSRRFDSVEKAGYDAWKREQGRDDGEAPMMPLDGEQ